MRLRRKVTLLPIAAATLLQGCASAVPPDALLQVPPESSVLSIADPQEIITWARPVHPQSNATFLTIAGSHYYVLGPGDEIEIELDLTGETRQFRAVVNPSGEIRIADIMGAERIPVAGLALPHAEERIVERFSRVLVRPNILLRVLNHNSSFATLVGEVTARTGEGGGGTGRYALTGRTDLLTFILSHSSPTEQSDLSSVIVATADGRTGVFDLSQTIYSGDQAQNPILDRGDVVTVPSLAVTRSRIYVLGEVERPGLITPRPGLTIMDALAEVGGLNERAATGSVSLVRGRGPQAEVYGIPYRRIVKGGAVIWNVPLQQGDIIYVSRSTYDTASQMVRDLWAVLQAAVVVTVLRDGGN